MATTELKDSIEETRPERSPSWMRIARMGAILMVIFAVSLTAMAREIIPPIAVIGLIYLVFVLLLTGERRKLGLGFGVLSIAILGGNIPFIASDLARPESSPTFVLTLLSLAAVSLAIVGGFGVFFGWTTGPIRGLVIGVAALFLAGSLTSVAIAVGTDSATALPSDTVVEAERLVWNPDEISAQAGTGIWINNLDPVHHSFTVPDLDIDIEIPALKAARVDLDVDSGTYRVICTVAGHEAMTGTLVVSS